MVNKSIYVLWNHALLSYSNAVKRYFNYSIHIILDLFNF